VNGGPLNIVAPVRDAIRFHRHPIRLPSQLLVNKIGMSMPIWLPIFNFTFTAAVLANENDFTATIDFWWLGTYILGGGAGFFNVQLSRSVTDENNNQEVYRFQKGPVNASEFGGNLNPAAGPPSGAFYLPVPVFFPAGTQLLVNASVVNFIGSAFNLPTQIVMLGATEGN
jgi:hypothetical protein